MNHEIFKDTIIAISTPWGYGGLGIIRISGRRAVPIAGKIFRTRNKTSIKDQVGRTVFGNLYDFEEKMPIDEGVLTYFRAPRSYTREDVVELSCHGSPVILETVLRLGVRAGARAAHPGEFTLRAYQNGRIDMIQAEAINDLIRAVSPLQARISYRQLSGSLSRKVKGIRSQILHLAAQLEAAIEFPEEELRIDSGKHGRTIDRLLGDIETLAASYEAGKIMKDGPVLAIAGRTNVGKSTLFNALLEEQRSIVTPYAGTTRDYLREKVILGDLAVNLIDMAGLRASTHPVDKEGMAKSRNMAESADGLLVVLDGSRKMSREDEKLIKKFYGKKMIIVVNKSDLRRRIDLGDVRSLSGKTPIVEISALRGSGLKTLKSRIQEFLEFPRDMTQEIIVHARQRDILREIHVALEKAGKLLDEQYPEEIVAEEMRSVIPLVGRLTGEIRTEDIMEDVFSRFCVGK